MHYQQRSTFPIFHADESIRYSIVPSLQSGFIPYGSKPVLDKISYHPVRIQDGALSVRIGQEKTTIDLLMDHPQVYNNDIVLF